MALDITKVSEYAILLSQHFNNGADIVKRSSGSIELRFSKTDFTPGEREQIFYAVLAFAGVLNDGIAAPQTVLDGNHTVLDDYFIAPQRAAIVEQTVNTMAANLSNFQRETAAEAARASAAASGVRPVPVARPNIAPRPAVHPNAPKAPPINPGPRPAGAPRAAMPTARPIVPPSGGPRRG